MHAYCMLFFRVGFFFSLSPKELLSTQTPHTEVNKSTFPQLGPKKRFHNTNAPSPSGTFLKNQKTEKNLLNHQQKHTFLFISNSISHLYSFLISAVFCYFVFLYPLSFSFNWKMNCLIVANRFYRFISYDWTACYRWLWTRLILVCKIEVCFCLAWFLSHYTHVSCYCFVHVISVRHSNANATDKMVSCFFVNFWKCCDFIFTKTASFSRIINRFFKKKHTQILGFFSMFWN